ncbi:MAG TPA: uroporphyrinogen decarboxylase, partial [Microthrixaceae bacterium]|nr:uroporphyrinogen decarboxylase [Microthrixaceae bacterium]
MTGSPAAPGPHDRSAFIRTCRGEHAEHTPVWFMRQAGRSLPEYRSIRGTGTILRAIADPDLATEITLQPVRRYGVDAAILYSDIMTPVHAVGFGVDIAPGVGPVVEHPFRDRSDLDRLRPLDAEADTPYVVETVRNLVRDLPVPLIAFAGAPFTVASYLLEGRPSRTYVATKALMHTDEALWHELMDRLADLAIASLRSQVDNGASAVQLFDSWAGALSPADYERFALPASSKVLAAAGELGVPRIHFGVTTGELLGLMAAAGAEVVGVDWRTPLDAARTRVTDAMQRHRLANPVLLGGDLHENWVGHVKADYTRPDSAALGVEFCGTSISSRAAAADNFAALLAENPHFVFADNTRKGYGLVDFTPTQLTTTLRVVDVPQYQRRVRSF